MSYDLEEEANFLSGSGLLLPILSTKILLAYARNALAILYICVRSYNLFLITFASVTTLQRQFRLYIPFLGIARPQRQFSYSCALEEANEDFFNFLILFIIYT